MDMTLNQIKMDWSYVSVNQCVTEVRDNDLLLVYTWLTADLRLASQALN
jgi:hypothetical protein